MKRKDVKEQIVELNGRQSYQIVVRTSRRLISKIFHYIGLQLKVREHKTGSSSPVDRIVLNPVASRIGRLWLLVRGEGEWLFHKKGQMMHSFSTYFTNMGTKKGPLHLLSRQTSKKTTTLHHRDT